MEIEQETPVPAEQSPAPEPEAVEPQEAQEENAQPDEQEAAEKPARSKSPREALERAFKAESENAKDEAVEPEAEVKPEYGPARGPDGKFAPKEAKPEQAAEPKADDKPNTAEPPSRIAANAKADWSKAPESIRAEFHRAVKEMEQGIEQYREQADRVKPLEPFYQMAEQSGVKLEDALGRYVNLENMLRKDPARGLQEVARNMGMAPQQAAALLTGQQPGQVDPRDRELMDLRQQVQQLSQGYGQVQQTFQQQREQQVMGQIESFAAEHPRFNELADDIAKMLDTGFANDLADAYEKADRLKPAPAPQPQAAPTAPAQTRQPKSLTGAPSPGSNPKANRAPSKSPREALSRAFGV